jgi:hypothetical protein
MKAFFVAGLIALWGQFASAAPTSWTLTYEDGSPLGWFNIDFETGAVSGSASGSYGTYSNLAFGLLGTKDSINGSIVHDFFKFLDPASGTLFTDDYGDGTGMQFRLNEAAIEFGTLAGPLSPLGGTFQVMISEIYNYDEITIYCSLYEDLYDPVTGDYLGEGRCLQSSSYGNFNIGTVDSYIGYLTYTPPVAAVPLPAGGMLLAGGLAALAVLRRRKR